MKLCIVFAALAAVTAAMGAERVEQEGWDARNWGHVTKLVREEIQEASVAIAALPEAEGPQREAALFNLWDNIKSFIKAIVALIRLLLDPAPLGDFDFNFDNNFLKGYLRLKSLSAKHLRDLNVGGFRINLSNFCLGMDIELPEIVLNAVYDVDADINLEEDATANQIRVFGKGPARIDVTKIKVYAEVCLVPKKLSFKIANMKVSVEETNVELQRLFGDKEVSTLISGIATDIIPAVIQEFQQEITGYIMGLINKFISGSLKQ